MSNGLNTLENEHLKAVVEADGSLTLTDKATGHTFSGLNVYEDSGDIGNEYMFRKPDGEVPLTTAGLAADIRVVEDAPYRAVIEAVHQWEIRLPPTRSCRKR